jgi:hypothetical protein
MPPSNAQKRAADKYNREHMTTLGCKVKKEDAAAFKDYAAERGKTSNTLLKDYVMECISPEQGSEPTPCKANSEVKERDIGGNSQDDDLQLTAEEKAHIEKRRVVLGQAQVRV